MTTPQKMLEFARRRDPSPTETKEGNTRYDAGLFFGAERYEFDFNHCKAEDGWQQYDTDQDASYFGIWVHIDGGLVVTFAEGDLSVVHCETKDSMKKQLDSMQEFYVSPPPAFIVVDTEQNTTTLLYDKRPEVSDG